MPSPTIQAANQPWTAGATWLNTNIGNQFFQDTYTFQNNSGTTLFMGDVVVIGNSTSGSFVTDPTGLGVTSTTTASDLRVVGVVGGRPYNPGSTTTTPATVGGGLIPPQTSSWVYSTGTWTSGTATLTDANGSTINIGKAVYGDGWPTTPGQQSIITAFSAGTYTVTVAPTVTHGSATSYFVGPAEGAVGPGFPGITGYGAGTPVPVVTSGWAYVNIGTNTVAASSSLATSATARVAAIPGTAASVAALQALVGSFFAVSLEAQSAGLGSPDGTTNKIIRCLIMKA